MNNTQDIFENEPDQVLKGKIIYEGPTSFRITFKPLKTFSKTCDVVLFHKTFSVDGREGMSCSKVMLDKSGVGGKKYTITGCLGSDRPNWENGKDVSDCKVQIFKEGLGSFRKKFVALFNNNIEDVEVLLKDSDRSFEKFEADVKNNAEKGLESLNETSKDSKDPQGSSSSFEDSQKFEVQEYNL